MLPIIAGVLVGAVLVARTKPIARSVKRELVGPSSGLTYRVDDFPQAGVMVVHAPGCVCTFARHPKPVFISARGNPQAIRAVIQDVDPKALEAGRKE